MATRDVPTLDGSGRMFEKHVPAYLTQAAQSAAYLPKWKATTAYLAGDKVLNPTGDVVSAKVDFTSGASYSSANWDLSTTYTTPTQAAGLSAALSIVFGG
ncbi:hypothetical protein [Arthrobacter sp. Soil762]|uniref:hypothetical protein n=1 Tax=Arthrobacter sp. Soil762 TaxID=1736401 RepID=UPI0006F9D764|nr:hypothetical protein [Arthrobacter sp. Soil762]KRE72573.1 hypothetical protein ASG77_07840 [Arthrobacter sp. Soil762]